MGISSFLICEHWLCLLWQKRLHHNSIKYPSQTEAKFVGWVNTMSAKSNYDEQPSSCSSSEEEEENVCEEEECWSKYESMTTEAFQRHHTPFIKVDLGAFKLHPRLRSLALSPSNDPSDPVNHHIIAAEKIYRESILTPPEKSVWFQYIENATLEKQFMLKKKELSETGTAEEVLLFHGTTSKTTYGICSSNINLNPIWGHINSPGSGDGMFYYSRHPWRIPCILGMYLSRHPNRILEFAEDLILCRVLLGLKKKNLDHHFDLKDLYDVQGYTSFEIEPSDPYFNEIVVRLPNQILPYCIISAEYREPRVFQDVLAKTHRGFCRKNGTGIFMNRIRAEGKQSRTQTSMQDIKVGKKDEERHVGTLEDSRRNEEGSLSSLRTFFNSYLTSIRTIRTVLRHFSRDAEISEIERMEEGRKRKGWRVLTDE